jgi:hypothetical protein
VLDARPRIPDRAKVQGVLQAARLTLTWMHACAQLVALVVAALQSAWFTYTLSVNGASYNPPSYEVCRWACTTTARVRMDAVNTLLLFQVPQPQLARGWRQSWRFDLLPARCRAAQAAV